MSAASSSLLSSPADSIPRELFFNLICEQYEKDLERIKESGVHKNFGEDHKELNRQVFSQLQDLIPFPDIHLQSHADLIYRFLIARKWDVVETCDNMRSYFTWRRNEKIDLVLWEKFDDELMEFGPVFRGWSNHKVPMPVTWQKPDPSKISALLSKYSQATLLRRNWMALEQARRLMAVSGADRMLAVWDLEKIGLALAMNPSAISFLKLVSTETQARYPELLLQMKLANGGRVLSFVWGIIKPFLDERVQKKIQDVGTGSEKIAAAISEFISLSEVSPIYGGTGPESVDLDPALAECMNQVVPPGTPPLRRATTNTRCEVLIPILADETEEQQQQSEDESVVADQGNANSNNFNNFSRTDSLVSAESGDLQEADIVISGQHANDQQTGQQIHFNPQTATTASSTTINTNLSTSDDSPLPTPYHSFSAVDATSAVAISNNNHQQKQQQMNTAGPTSTTTVAKNITTRTTHTTTPKPSFAPRLPPLCHHLFVTLKPEPFPTLEIVTRTEFVKPNTNTSTSAVANNNNSNHLSSLASPFLPPKSPTTPTTTSTANDKILRNLQDIVSSLKVGEETFTTVGLKVLGTSSSSSSSALNMAIPKAEVVGESGHLLRSHLLVLDDKKRVHFVLQRGAIRNEIRVFRPANALEAAVQQKKSMQYEGPKERIMFAKILPLPGGGWYALRVTSGSSDSSSNKKNNNQSSSGSPLRSNFDDTKSTYSTASSSPKRKKDGDDDDDADSLKASAISAVQHQHHHDAVLARCIDVPVSDIPLSFATKMFQTSPNDDAQDDNNNNSTSRSVHSSSTSASMLKIPRNGAVYQTSKSKTSVGFHRSISFEQEFLQAPVGVLSAFVAAVDACFLQDEK